MYLKGDPRDHATAFELEGREASHAAGEVLESLKRDVKRARTALHECERLRPGFLESRRGWQRYAEAPRNEQFFAGLRRHGLFD